MSQRVGERERVNGSADVVTVGLDLTFSEPDLENAYCRHHNETQMRYDVSFGSPIEFVLLLGRPTSTMARAVPQAIMG